MSRIVITKNNNVVKRCLHDRNGRPCGTPLAIQTSDGVMFAGSAPIYRATADGSISVSGHCPHCNRSYHVASVKECLPTA